MTGMTLKAPLNISVGALLSRGMAILIGLVRSRQPKVLNIAAALNDKQRSDLGIENPPLDPVSKFQGFELDLWIAKQSRDALQHELLRGIDR